MIDFTEWIEKHEPKHWAKFEKIPDFVLKKMWIKHYGEYLFKEWEKFRKEHNGKTG